MATTLDIQKKLITLGFDPGVADGIPGRRTAAAILAFQKSQGLEITGLANPDTLVKLFGDDAKAGDPPWLEIALSKLNLHETRNKASLMKFLALGKGTIGDPARVPWCGDYVETCLAVALPSEVLPVNPYGAKNWLDFGVYTTPRPGAILVFHRGNPNDWAGHVGFYVGEDATHFYVLGGNQSNAVTITRIRKNRLVAGGVRWPSTYAVVGRARQMNSKNIKETSNEA